MNILHFIHGVIMLDLKNRPVKDLRVSVIDNCNYRCGYCMPAGKTYNFLAEKDRLTVNEFHRIVTILVGLGVKRVRLTGGEPLMRKDILDIVSALSVIDGIEDFSLTTNGQLLPRYAAKLKNHGLRRVTVSLDSLNPDTFSKMSGGRGDLKTVLQGIDAALESGLTPIKFNAVIKKGMNDHEVLDLLKFARERNCSMRFIEYMDVGNCNGWDPKYVVPSKLILKQIEQQYKVESVEPAFYGEVASRYHFDDGIGELGFISSVTEPFCGSCTRMRLSADGKIYTCLFSGKGTSIMELMRQESNDRALIEFIKGLWRHRNDQYSEDRFSRKNEEKVEMFRIGG